VAYFTQLNGKTLTKIENLHKGARQRAKVMIKLNLKIRLFKKIRVNVCL